MREGRRLAGPTQPVWQVAFSPDSTLLASGGVDGTIRIWRVADGSLVRTLPQPAGVTCLAISRDGQWLATGSYDALVRRWRMSDGALVQTLSGHTGTVWSVAFSPDGQLLASAGEDKSVNLWNLGDGIPQPDFHRAQPDGVVRGLQP